MNIKKETINLYIKNVEGYIFNKNYLKALEIAANFPLGNGFTICQTSALAEFMVNKEQLNTVNNIEKDNPHYRNASKMKIFLVAELESQFKRRVRKKLGNKKKNKIHTSILNQD